MSSKKLAEEILKNIGRETNVNSLVHCVTRLRFKLVDNSKANKINLENLKGVLSVVESGGQFQVVIGNKVEEVYKEIIKSTNILSDSKVKNEEVKAKNNILGKVLDIVSSIFAPVLNILASISILKGFLAIFVYLNYISTSSGGYHLLNAIVDDGLYFMPILMAYTAAKKFGANEIISLILGAILVHPDIINFISKSESVDFFRVHIKSIEYGYTFIPIIISVWLLSKLEKFLNKTMNSNLKLFFMPLVCLMIITPLLFIVIGPASMMFTKTLGYLYSFIYNLSPIVLGAVIGATWQMLVIKGIHWLVMPIIMNNFCLYGFDTIFALAISGSVGQVGAVLGVLAKTKNKQIRKVAISTIPSGLLGITEPTIYGITLKYKTPFICASIAGAVGGSISGHFGSATMGYIIPGFLTLPVYFGKGFEGLLIAVAISYILAAVLSFITFKDPIEYKNDLIEGKKPIEKTIEEEIIMSPLNGEIIELSQVADEAFSSEALGKGIAMVPSEGKLVSPVDGIISVVFPTGHAIGITSENGAELLIHIGFNTVSLEGKYFEAKVKQGQKIKKGELLVEFDVNKIKKAGFDITTPIVVTNTYDYYEVSVVNQGIVRKNDPILHLVK